MAGAAEPIAAWPLSLPRHLPAQEVQRIAAQADLLGERAQYGWGHTIDFGPFRKEGLLGNDYLRIAGAFDSWGWWPERLDGLTLADVGCFTGGIALLMAHRGAEVVWAIDEIPSHAAQCELVAAAFGAASVRVVTASAYRLGEVIEPGTVDLVVLAGVLYHLSDMLAGLHAMRELLRPGGLLLLQSHALEDYERSYADFGRFVAGRWWQPTALCIRDMLEFMGFEDCELRFNRPYSCLARALRSDAELPYTRGLNLQLQPRPDARPRPLDMSLLAPAHPPEGRASAARRRLATLRGRLRRRP